jgi:hypothetical protein
VIKPAEEFPVVPGLTVGRGFKRFPLVEGIGERSMFKKPPRPTPKLGIVMLGLELELVFTGSL